MSETERMKAERAARVALEEERIKTEKEAVSGGGKPLPIRSFNQYHFKCLHTII